MKHIPVLLLTLLLGVTAAIAREAPSPAASIQFELQQDARTWIPAHSKADKQGLVQDFVPEGHELKSWEEMLTRQVLFTKVPLRKFVNNWHRMLIRADRKHRYAETTDENGAIIAEYQVPSAKETGIRKFIQGPDGIYMLAYQVRPTSLDDDNYKTWKQIITTATLVGTDEAP